MEEIISLEHTNPLIEPPKDLECNPNVITETYGVKAVVLFTRDHEALPELDPE